MSGFVGRINYLKQAARAAENDQTRTSVNLTLNEAESIQKTGVFGDGYLYTTQAYYNAAAAGQQCGVRDHYINCVLKFADDGNFQSGGIVPGTGRFTGGADQWINKSRPKPIAKRKISETEWTLLIQN